MTESTIIDIHREYTSSLIGFKGDDTFPITVPEGFSVKSVSFNSVNPTWFWGSVKMGESRLIERPPGGASGSHTLKVHWWCNGLSHTSYDLKVAVEGPHELPSQNPPTDAPEPVEDEEQGVIWRTMSLVQGSADTFLIKIDESPNDRAPASAKVTRVTINTPPELRVPSSGGRVSMALKHKDASGTETAHNVRDEEPSAAFHGQSLYGLWSGALYNYSIDYGDDLEGKRIEIFLEWTALPIEEMQGKGTKFILENWSGHRRYIYTKLSEADVFDYVGVLDDKKTKTFSVPCGAHLAIVTKSEMSTSDNPNTYGTVVSEACQPELVTVTERMW